MNSIKKPKPTPEQGVEMAEALAKGDSVIASLPTSESQRKAIELRGD